MSMIELLERFEATSRLECYRDQDGVRLVVTNPPLGGRDGPSRLSQCSQFSERYHGSFGLT